MSRGPHQGDHWASCSGSWASVSPSAPLGLSSELVNLSMIVQFGNLEPETFSKAEIWDALLEIQQRM